MNKQTSLHLSFTLLLKHREARVQLCAVRADVARRKLWPWPPGGDPCASGMSHLMRMPWLSWGLGFVTVGAGHSASAAPSEPLETKASHLGSQSRQRDHGPAKLWTSRCGGTCLVVRTPCRSSRCCWKKSLQCVCPLEGAWKVKFGAHLTHPFPLLTSVCILSLP